MNALAVDWADPSAIGYPVLAGGVLLGSILPVIPTGPLVGVATAVAMTTSQLSLPLVLLVSAAAALAGDLVTFALCRFGGAKVVDWVSRGQDEERLASARQRFERGTWQIVITGRLVPAGRIPVLVVAGALETPWRRIVPPLVVADILWAAMYAVLGVTTGGIFDSPLLASLVVTAIALLLTGVLTLVSRRRRARAATPTVRPEDPGPVGTPR